MVSELRCSRFYKIYYILKLETINEIWKISRRAVYEKYLETKQNEIVSYDKQSENLKKKLAKNDEDKMVIYNALPKKEFQRIFMCNTAKDIWRTLLVTHQGNNQVKDNKIDLVVQQYE